MSSKTVSLKIEAYERLRSARRHASESFSQVVLRARWSDDTVTGRGLLSLYREEAPFSRGATSPRPPQRRRSS